MNRKITFLGLCVNINNHSKPAFRLFGIFFKLSLNSVRVRFKKMTV
ncbi:hypothetical protein [uncultured Gammaproteobacteria bacterium]|nr:hypothetical protein [uncultured Gammaproteobacteria bacterium]CAC9552839.1 hypothetical protein [uncultured Gammaproteobacteria bacterium]CAC9958037.1 hypothetical protein [uncultured Gammaproteobacteria bacterium]